MGIERLWSMGLQPITIEIIQHSNDFFGIADPEGKALFVNAAGRKIFGLAEDRNIDDLTMLDFIASRDHALFAQEVLIPAQATTGSINRQVHVRNFANNEVFMMEFSFFLNRDSEGQPLCFMAFGKDLRTSYETQELLSSIQNSLNVGGWQLDLHTNRAIWSEKVYEIHKVPVGTPTDKIIAIDFYAPHERKRITDCVDACVADGTPYDEEFEFFDAEGHHKWIRTSGSPIYDDDGAIIKIRGTFQDITERKRLELESEETNIELEMFKAVIENSPDFIGIANQSGTPIYVNPAGRRMVGLSPDFDIRTVTVAEHYPERIRHHIAREIFTAMETRGTFEAETFFRNFSTDEEIPVLDSHFVVNDSRTGERLGLATITRDISNEIALRDALEVEKNKLAQAAKMASLGELAAGIAHEINNPLTVIAGHTGIINKSEPDPVKLSRATEKINKSVERISAIVKGLKNFSRTSPKLTLVETDLNHVITECIQLVAPKAQNTRHRIEFTPTTPPPLCPCDEIQMEQVIINLLVNSIDANEDNADSWTRILTQADAANCTITVMDSGAGIEPQLVDSIFDPFVTTKDVGAGTGLGLSISSGIISDHGGSLDYELIDGHTAFVIRLPLAV